MLWNIFFFSPYWIVYLSYVIEFLSSIFLHLNFYIVIMLFLFILSYFTGSTLSKLSVCPGIEWITSSRLPLPHLGSIGIPLRAPGVVCVS